MIENIKKQLKELLEFNFVLKQLIRQQLILRYRRTALGYIWTLVNPIMMMTVTALVFSALLKHDLRVYAVFLFAGMIPWNFFNSCIIQSGNSFINNEGLIKKIYLPKNIFPISVTLGIFIDSLFSFFALFLIILILGGKISYALLFIPVAFILLFFFTLGISLIISIATVFFRDLQYIVTVATQALFFLTPIMYEKEMLQGKVGLLINLNPVAPFIELFRAPLYSGAFPSLVTVIVAIVIALISITLGLYIFIKNENKLVFRL